MEIFEKVLYGFQIAVLPMNLVACFIGVSLGTFIGVLPGLGPIATISILFPITLTMPPETAIIMLAGIFYGAQYGGSTTSILVNLPGEATSVITTLDGYKMATQGRGGPALAIAAIGSFIGGTLALGGVMFLSAPLANFALRFGPPEYCALIFLALTIVTSLAVGSPLRAAISATLGMLVGIVGMDMHTGTPRFTMDVRTYYDGIDLVPVIMGLFGVGQILCNLEKRMGFDTVNVAIGKVWPSMRDWVDSRMPILRGSVVGFFLGLIPGGGALIATFASYALEKRLSRHPEKFGHGAIEGVAGPETANNAGAQACFIPLLSFGIPSNAATAVLLGALTIHGIAPGPMLVNQHPEIFWGIITSMYIGNIMLVILNLPLIGVWIQVLKMPNKFLFPLILLFCMVGVYCTNNNVVDIFTMVFFGFVGYLMEKFNFEPAPFVIAMVLGRIFEDSFRQSLTMSDGSFGIFFSRPLSAVFVITALLVLVGYLFAFSRKRKQKIMGVAE